MENKMRHSCAPYNEGLFWVILPTNDKVKTEDSYVAWQITMPIWGTKTVHGRMKGKMAAFLEFKDVTDYFDYKGVPNEKRPWEFRK